MINWFELQNDGKVTIIPVSMQDIENDLHLFFTRFISIWISQLQQSKPLHPWVNGINYTFDTTDLTFNATITPPHGNQKKFTINLKGGIYLAAQDISYTACSYHDFISELWPGGGQIIKFDQDRFPTRFFDYGFLINQNSFSRSTSLILRAPLQERRIEIGSMLALIITSWVLLHEEGHLMGGHLHWLKNKKKISIDELNFWKESSHIFNTSTNILLNKAIELDADMYATQGVVDMFLTNFEDAPYLELRNEQSMFRIILVGVLIGSIIFEAARTKSNVNPLGYPSPYSRFISIARAAVGRAIYGTNGDHPVHIKLTRDTCFDLLGLAIDDMQVICSILGISPISTELINDIASSLFEEGFNVRPPKTKEGKEFVLVDQIHKTELQDLKIFNKQAFEWVVGL
jgi:hypothetical protein